MEQRNAREKKATWKRAAALILAGLVLAVSICVTAIPNGWRQVYALFGLTEVGDLADGYPFAMHVLDVGKADAILVACGGNYLLVDCGMSDDSSQVLAYLSRRGVRHLDYAVGTHPDSDHIGGYPALLAQMSVNVFLEPVIADAFLEDNEDYALLAAALEKQQVLCKRMAAGDSFALGQSQVEVLSPAGEMDSSNNSSLVLRITYGETSFLLMGDAEAEAEALLLSSGAELRADVLKVGHHGSATSTTEAFLQAVSPAYAAVSVGPDRNNLPKDEIMQRLESHHAALYQTDLDGTLVFASDGQAITVFTENGAGS